MRTSLLSLGRSVYDERQIASALLYIARPDEQLIDDGTYFVAVAGANIIGCGGWSRRRKVYSGSAAAGDKSALIDPATEPARIRAMFVRPEWARRGIGRRILPAFGRACGSGRLPQFPACRDAERGRDL